jgi:hypothetical protein
VIAGTLSVKVVTELPDTGLTAAEPIEGVPVHGKTPVPVTATLAAEAVPPPVMAMLLL